MRDFRAVPALVVTGVLVALAACTGASSRAPSPTATTSPSVVAPTLANGQPLPAGCPAGERARAQTVAFVAGGNAWVLDPETEDATCLFATPAPGPFAWNPRGDRALLDGLEISSIDGRQLRAGSTSTNPVFSWGHPIGKAIAYISPNARRLIKIYPGTQHRDDITPLDHVHYLNVIYHPSGLALAFVVDTGDGQEIWLSSNLGEDPVRLVFAAGATTFGALGFLPTDVRSCTRPSMPTTRRCCTRSTSRIPLSTRGCGTGTPGTGSQGSSRSPSGRES
jgi:hypothetical protein